MKPGVARKNTRLSKRACINHPDIQGVRRCDRCYSWICSDCIEEGWHQTFLRGFLAEKQRFEKEILCPNCARRISRLRLAGYSFFLVLIFGILSNIGLNSFGDTR